MLITKIHELYRLTKALTFFDQFFLALKSYHNAFSFIDKNKLWKTFLIPSVITLFISLVIGYLAWIFSDDIVEYLIGLFEIRTLPDYWGEIMEFIFVMMIRGLTLFLFIKVYRYFVLFFFAPVLAYISKKVYCIDSGEKYTFNIGFYSGRMMRGVVVASQNLIMELALTILVIFLSLVITWLAPLGPLMVLIVESYFFGLAMIDYRNQCKGMQIKESRMYSRRNSGLAIGNGLYFNLILLIPIIGVMIAPILALIAAGLAVNEFEKAKDYDIQIDKPLQ